MFIVKQIIASDINEPVSQLIGDINKTLVYAANCCPNEMSPHMATHLRTHLQLYSQWRAQDFILGAYKFQPIISSDNRQRKSHA